MQLRKIRVPGQQKRGTVQTRRDDRYNFISLRAKLTLVHRLYKSVVSPNANDASRVLNILFFFIFSFFWRSTRYHIHIIYSYILFYSSVSFLILLLELCDKLS